MVDRSRVCEPPTPDSSAVWQLSKVNSIGDDSSDQQVLSEDSMLLTSWPQSNHPGWSLGPNVSNNFSDQENGPVNQDDMESNMRRRKGRKKGRKWGGKGGRGWMGG